MRRWLPSHNNKYGTISPGIGSLSGHTQHNDDDDDEDNDNDKGGDREYAGSGTTHPPT